MPTSVPGVRVLVLDGDQASTLAIVRSLGRKGMHVDVAASVASPLAGASRYVARTVAYPDPLTRDEEFVAWLRQSLAEQRYDVVIPVTERSLVPLLRHRPLLPDARIAMAPSDALEQVLDKGRTLALAQELGISVPRSMHIDSPDRLPLVADLLGYPVVVKPARSIGQAGGEGVHLSVAYAHNRTELDRLAGQALQFGPVLLQELFLGDGVGIELIAAHGEVRHVFQHRRLHEVPLTGGGSSLRVSEAVDPVLESASRTLMKALGWHGVAMVEFKRNPANGEYRLMEVNGRFWGSLALAVAAGADFPSMLVELMTTGRVTGQAPARTGIVCRHLARDVDWMERVLRGGNLPRWVARPTWGQVVRDGLLVLSPRHYFDVQSLSDPRPGLADLGQIVRRQWQRMSARLRQRRRLAAELRTAAPAGLARRRLQDARQVLFLCYGNINRSALAHAFAQARHGSRLAFSSAGFHAAAGRPADPVMVAVAAEAGVDLSDWRSHTLDAEMVDRADVILAMEAAHLDRLVQEHPSARGKAFLLGAAAAGGPNQVEVVDPYGQPRAVYEAVCRQVLRAVDAWLAPSRS